MLEKIVTFFRGLFLRDPPTQEEPLLVRQMLDGPFHSDDLGEGEDCPEDAYMVVVKTSQGKEMQDLEIWFEDLDSALKLKRYFETNIEPLMLEKGI